MVHLPGGGAAHPNSAGPMLAHTDDARDAPRPVAGAVPLSCGAIPHPSLGAVRRVISSEPVPVPSDDRRTDDFVVGSRRTAGEQAAVPMMLYWIIRN
ncbi:hypothetical protein [Amycolatopsis alkalitolerans]|uniref:Uncharacterized protein n=1 Tax=Amycolatopsis alkalitolerans TaxID=2547244 RepID=A0A5C4LTA5_9PSEU|nr:hypothetical protein [Amycolatopsis alkalitolerans]TNC20598.1 hypothetical protein FG385_30755 [Amycolatopsis alkalitolerans]